MPGLIPVDQVLASTLPDGSSGRAFVIPLGELGLSADIIQPPDSHIVANTGVWGIADYSEGLNLLAPSGLTSSAVLYVPLYSAIRIPFRNVRIRYRMVEGVTVLTVLVKINPPVTPHPNTRDVVQLGFAIANEGDPAGAEETLRTLDIEPEQVPYSPLYEYYLGISVAVTPAAAVVQFPFTLITASYELGTSNTTGTVSSQPLITESPDLKAVFGEEAGFPGLGKGMRRPNAEDFNWRACNA